MHMSVVFITCCLGFFCVLTWLQLYLVLQETVSDMTYNVLMER